MFHHSVKNKVIHLNLNVAKIPLMGVLDNFFPVVPIIGIGTSVLSLKHAMKSTTKKES